MNKKEFLEFHKSTCEKLIDLTRTKNADYSNDNDNPFHNFESVEKLDVTTTEIGFMTRIMDKYNRINSFIKQGFYYVEDEKIEDTCLDAANYFIMLAAWFKHKKEINNKL